MRSNLYGETVFEPFQLKMAKFKYLKKPLHQFAQTTLKSMRSIVSMFEEQPMKTIDGDTPEDKANRPTTD